MRDFFLRLRCANSLVALFVSLPALLVWLMSLSACGLFVPQKAALPDTARQARFHVEAMHCADCLGSIDQALRDLPGVYLIEIDMQGEEIRVDFEPGQADLQAMAAAISRVGYPARLIDP